MPSPLGKIPPWGWALGAVGIGGGLYLYKKRKESSEETGPTEAGPETVTEPYPYSYGGEAGGGYSGGVGGGAIGGSESAFHELFSSFQTEQREMSQAQIEQENTIARQIQESEQRVAEILRGSGSAPGGTVSGGSGGGAPETPREKTTVAPKSGSSPCPPGYLHSSRGCYKITTKSIGKKMCECHTYKDKSECQHVSGGKCVW